MVDPAQMEPLETQDLAAPMEKWVQPAHLANQEPAARKVRLGQLVTLENQAKQEIPATKELTVIQALLVHRDLLAPKLTMALMDCPEPTVLPGPQAAPARTHSIAHAHHAAAADRLQRLRLLPRLQTLLQVRLLPQAQ